MSVRCRLGHHTYKPTPTVVDRPNAWTSSWTNAKCVRCPKRAWVNRTTRAARQASLEQVADAAREVVNDGTSRTALARLAATVEALDAQEPA